LTTTNANLTSNRSTTVCFSSESALSPFSSAYYFEKALSTASYPHEMRGIASSSQPSERVVAQEIKQAAFVYFSHSACSFASRIEIVFEAPIGNHVVVRSVRQARPKDEHAVHDKFFR
jgi:hypothetical protein